MKELAFNFRYRLRCPKMPPDDCKIKMIFHKTHVGTYMKTSLQESNSLLCYFVVGALFILAMKCIHLVNTQVVDSTFNVLLMATQ